MARITKIEATKVSRVKKTRVAAYARVSTDSDEQLLSLETQKAHYEEYIKSNQEWEFAGLYYDEGISATKVIKRNDLLRLLADCEAGKIDRVITKSISRFARNTTDCLEMVRRLSKLNISIFFEKENIDTAHMSSELMLSILSAIAEGESRSISENARWSIRHRFENGTYIIAYPPYGYENQDGQMIVVPEEAEVVKEIFSRSLSGQGSHVIAAELNRREIPSKRGAKWHASTVEGILKNEKYTGDVLFQKTWTDGSFTRHYNYGEEGQYLHRNHHEAIISHEDFEKSVEMMHRRGREKGIEANQGKYLKRYALSGKLICSECGGTFKRRTHYKPSGDYIAWTCGTHLADKNTCTMKYIEDELIKLAFIRLMNKLHVGHEVVLKPFIASLRGYDNKEKLHQIMDLEARIEKCAEQEQILTQLMASGYIEPDIFYQEKSALDTESAALAKEKEQISCDINGDLKHLEAAEKLMKVVSRKSVPYSFDDEIFEEHVESVTILSREKVRFNLKCGLQLEERMVKP